MVLDNPVYRISTYLNSMSVSTISRLPNLHYDRTHDVKAYGLRVSAIGFLYYVPTVDYET